MHYSLMDKPIVAHIERYEATRSDLNFVEEWMIWEPVCRSMQTVSSEKEGFSIKRFCRKLMKYDLVQFVV